MKDKIENRSILFHVLKVDFFAFPLLSEHFADQNVKLGNCHS